MVELARKSLCLIVIFLTCCKDSVLVPEMIWHRQALKAFLEAMLIETLKQMNLTWYECFDNLFSPIFIYKDLILLSCLSMCAYICLSKNNCYSKFLIEDTWYKTTSLENETQYAFYHNFTKLVTPWVMFTLSFLSRNQICSILTLSTSN